MKKFLSLVLSLLMLALPVFSVAEESVSTAASFPSIYNYGPTQRYASEGQTITYDVAFQLGDGVAAFIPDEQTLTAVKDLFNALSLQTKFQATEGNLQGSLGILLNGTVAANLTLAFTSNGLFATSNLLDGEIYSVSNEELQTLLTQVFESLQASGEGSGLTEILQDPTALLGSMDMTALNESLAALLANTTTEDISGCDLMAEATKHTTITLKKAELAKFMEEYARFFYNIPLLRQVLAQNAGTTAEELDVEALVKEVSATVDQIKDDFDLHIYTNDAGDKQVVVTDIPLVPTEEEGADTNKYVEVKVMNSASGGDFDVDVFTALHIGDRSAQVTFSAAGTGASFSLDIFVASVDGESVTEPLNLHLVGNGDIQEDRSIAVVTASLKIATNPDAPVTINVTDSWEDIDKGDHAESSESTLINIEGLGDLLTVNRTSVTGLAEAYIDSADAVHPMSMSAEDQQTLLTGITEKLQTGLITVLTQLPESVLKLMSGTSAE